MQEKRNTKKEKGAIRKMKESKVRVTAEALEPNVYGIDELFKQASWIYWLAIGAIGGKLD